MFHVASHGLHPRVRAPAEKIYQDFISRDYWQTLMDAYRFLTPQSEITTFSSTERGTDIVFIQNLPRMYLPAIARTVVPVDMVITRKQHFDPFDHAKSRAKGTYSASIPHGPGSFGGQYFLTETDTGSWMPAAGERLQGLHPVVRGRRAGGPDPAPHQTALRRRGGVHR